MSATLYYTNSGTITYYWIRSSDNAHLGSGSFDLDGTSPDNFTATLTLGSTGYVNTSTYYLYIDHPNHQQFGGVQIPIVCTMQITSNGGGDTASISHPENSTTVTTVTTNPTGSTFSITGGTDAAAFTIHPTTGVLTFNVAPNYEAPHDSDTNNTYVVNVRAVNGSATDDQLITVTVTDVNEHTPVITSNGGGDNAAISVAENTTAVTTVTATDADGTASLTYSISGGSDAARFTIHSTTGVLTFASAPDYENPVDSNTDNDYVVIVQVSDGTNTDSQTITVTVTNVAPTITSNGGGSTASVSIVENTTAVTTVIATDPAGGTITYSISGGEDQARFNIDSVTGVLTFAVAPDYENPLDVGGNNTYIVEVRASDGFLTDSQEITVSVTDDPGG
jgi:serralysin